MSDDLLPGVDPPGLRAPKTRAKLNQREHRFQSWTDRLLDRIILPPCFITAIDQAGKDTDNARARMQGRGAKFGIPDHWVFQGNPIVAGAFELKVGRNDTTDRQEARMKALRDAGVHADAAWSLWDVLAIARKAGFRLHGNAENICIEMTARWEADEHRRQTAAPKKSSSRAPEPRTTKAGLRAGRTLYGPR